MSILQILRQKGRPRQVVVQLTNRCNAHCAQCGMRATAGGARGDMEIDTAKKIIDRCAALGVSALSFTGGEPLLCDTRLCTLLTYAGQAGIRYLRTGTNGYRFANPGAPGFSDRVARLADALARTPVRNVWISLDSADAATHEANRGFPGLIEGLARALPLFHDRGIYPTANLAINRLMGGPDAVQGRDDAALYAAAGAALTRFFTTAAGLGFTIANCCYPMSDADQEHGTTAEYAASSADGRVTFGAWEKAALFRAVLDTVPRNRDKLRIFTPQSAVYALWRHYAGAPRATRPCLGGVSFFYVNRFGDTFPCGYRGTENLGPFWKMREDQLAGTPHCRICDWECFRDPSELLAPFEDLLAGPAGWGRLLRADRRQLGYWLSDLRYYKACGDFDGRRPPEPARLARYAGQSGAAPGPGQA
ncbi:radical SAM protein [Desulfovibrio aerotolerans]|uniref:Radical SAM protein n=1 Tax=Solidesulfovibrio aerotolerans TaxID=295255 RepID=A0A7C9IKH4_9BACT|nr:radical SAM protein [Solidesulfovibrio aerotolerans]